LHLERADGVLVERGGEDDLRRRAVQRPQHLEAIHTRHLYVEEDEIWPLLLDHPDRLDAVLRLAHQLHAVDPREERPQPIARELLAVDDERADASGRHAAPPARKSIRSRPLTRPPARKSIRSRPLTRRLRRANLSEVGRSRGLLHREPQPYDRAAARAA